MESRLTQYSNAKAVAAGRLLFDGAEEKTVFDVVCQTEAVFVKILQKNWLGVFLSLKNLSRGFAPTLRYPRIFF